MFASRVFCIFDLPWIFFMRVVRGQPLMLVCCQLDEYSSTVPHSRVAACQDVGAHEVLSIDQLLSAVSCSRNPKSHLFVSLVWVLYLVVLFYGAPFDARNCEVETDEFHRSRVQGQRVSWNPIILNPGKPQVAGNHQEICSCSIILQGTTSQTKIGIGGWAAR